MVYGVRLRLPADRTKTFKLREVTEAKKWTDLPSWIPSSLEFDVTLYIPKNINMLWKTRKIHINCVSSLTLPTLFGIFFGIEIVLTEKERLKSCWLDAPIFSMTKHTHSFTYRVRDVSFSKRRCSNCKYPSKWVDTTEIRATATTGKIVSSRLVSHYLSFSSDSFFRYPFSYPNERLNNTNELSRSTLAAIERIFCLLRHRMRKKQD